MLVEFTFPFADVDVYILHVYNRICKCALPRNCDTTIPGNKSVTEKSSFVTNIHNFIKCEIDLPLCENRLEMWENGKTWELLWRPSDEMAGHISGSQNSNPELFSYPRLFLASIFFLEWGKTQNIRLNKHSPFQLLQLLNWHQSKMIVWKPDQCVFNLFWIQFLIRFLFSHKRFLPL